MAQYVFTLHNFIHVCYGSNRQHGQCSTTDWLIETSYFHVAFLFFGKEEKERIARAAFLFFLIRLLTAYYYYALFVKNDETLKQRHRPSLSRSQT